MSLLGPVDRATVDEWSVMLGHDPDLVDELRVRVRAGRIDVAARDAETFGRVRFAHLIEDPEDDDPGSS